MTTYAASPTFSSHWSALRERIEHRIPELIDIASSADLEKVPSSQLMRGVTQQALVSSRGGKRLRALLTLITAEVSVNQHVASSQLSPEALLDVACAIEIFQTGALVHDDIIDDSDLRRGIPAAHRGLAAIFSDFSANLTTSGPAATEQTASSSTLDDNSAQSVGNGLGIMLGDLLATESLLIASTATAGSPLHEPITTAFLRMQKEVEIGQVMDLADTVVRLDDPEAMINNCLAVFRWKTASYTTIAPLELGFLGAGLSPQNSKSWAQRIGTPLGTAFQLADDLIDVDAEPTAAGASSSGKPLGGDIKEGKHTVLLADALLAASPTDRTALQDAYEAPTRDDATAFSVIDIFKRSGAVESSRRRIASLWKDTEFQLAQWKATTGASDKATATLTDACRRFLPQL
ncbi:MAG: polyprenyl synthetase family protein [Bifidobacteriaceae bacterium]|jgi:geranylgeranyl diphosphate synthase type I|nr:polyprenyl synthetase family protein [Bifidobacteriaceae bacterium]